MLHLSQSQPAAPAPATALILSDRLIALAEDADRAGLSATATRLVRLACTVLDEAPAVRLRQPARCDGAALPGPAQAIVAGRPASTTCGR